MIVGEVRVTLIIIVGTRLNRHFRHKCSDTWRREIDLKAAWTLSNGPGSMPPFTERSHVRVPLYLEKTPRLL